ncbi:UNVERIFIED_CONTAM: hypothetical protein Sangu_0415700 [Sesamum angustifolium]|uniref:Gamma-tubulin complex component n=1 Tax=Sesamum angustifolium TaxID=2727405 RepID=A0AAW2QUB4_9LAMI
MAGQSSTSVMDSLLEKLRLDDPWVPPRSWDSLPSQAGASPQPSSNSNPALYTTSTVSVADRDHSALLKFLFVQTYEPYSDFIRSWIFDGSISDPYHEFIVECVDELSIYASGDSGVALASPLPTIRSTSQSASLRLDNNFGKNPNHQASSVDDESMNPPLTDSKNQKIYKYLSKLTIKLLIEGYKLREHLRALRCYHFMELADWADLFIMSLWRRKWHVNEVDKRIPEIQGVLELAVQRSSCEGDPNKDRLYVYLKGEGVTHLSASAMGTFCI